MGKKSRRGGRGKSTKGSAAAAVSGVTPPFPTGDEDASASCDDFPWEVLPPIVESTKIRSLASRMVDNARSRRGTTPWRIWARRANMFFGDVDFTNPKKKQHRAWWICLAFCPPGGDTPCAASASVLVEDSDVISSTTDPNCLRHPLTSTMVLAALQTIADDKKVFPSEVVFWPTAFDGSFRIESVRKLVADMKKEVGDELIERHDGAGTGGGLVIRALSVEPMTDYALPGGPASSFAHFDPSVSPHDTDPELKLFSDRNYHIIRSMERRMIDAERTIVAEHSGSKRSSSVKCLSETLPRMSIAEMRLAFSAARTFHDVRPWELISNFHPVIVTVPNITLRRKEDGDDGVVVIPEADGKMRKFVAVVAGNGCWDSRGLYLYDSWDAMLDSCKMRAAKQIVLQYFDRTVTPFRTLDLIEELGLEISDTGDGGKKCKYVPEDAYPCYFSMNKPLNAGPTNDSYNTPPKLQDLNCAALAVMAIAKFTSNPLYAHHATNQSGDPCFSFAQDPVSITVEIGPAGGASTADAAAAAAASISIPTTVHVCSIDNPSQYAISKEDEAPTLSTGSREECNYCQKPSSVVRRDGGAKLAKCGRCHSVRYCSTQCQYADWPRHKRECKRTTAKSD